MLAWNVSYIIRTAGWSTACTNFTVCSTEVRK